MFSLWALPLHQLIDMLDVLIAKWKVKQLIVVQLEGSWISASVHLFVYACVMLRNARSTSFSAQAYSRSECHPYNIRTWTALYITRFYGTKWLWVSRLHDEYTYQAVNTYTGHYALSIVTLTARACTVHAKTEELPKWPLLSLASINSLPVRLFCMHSRMH